MPPDVLEPPIVVPGRFSVPPLFLAPVPNAPSEYFGKARGYDVIFLLLESLPDVCYDVAMADRVMPNMTMLEQRGIVPSAHYSTYPYSRRAYMSIFTSWYPLSGIRDEMARFAGLSRDLRAPGVVHSAAVSGYETAAFVSSFVLDARFGLDQGFATYDDRVATATGAAFAQGTNERAGPATTDAAALKHAASVWRQWLARN